MDDQDKQLLNELGVESSNEQVQQTVLANFYETVNTRVGMALESELTDEQLREFDEIESKGDDEATSAWLRSTLPNYEEIVNREVADTKEQLRETIKSMREATE